jgi:ABC-type branched-subunit amino acid transport system substrate-binding protein
MRTKRFAGVAVALLVALGLAACGSGKSSSTTAGGGSGAKSSKSSVVLYLVSAKTAGLDLLDHYSAGAQAAVQKINASGGFGGRHVVLQTCNSALQPAQAVVCAHKVVAAHAVAMWGCEPAWSASGLSVLQAAGIPSFNCPNTKADYTNPTSFSIFPGGTPEYSAAAKYICTLPGVKTVYWIAQANPEQQADVPPALTEIYNGCGKKISFEWFPFTAVDVSPYVAKIVQAHPDFVMMNVSGAASVSVVKNFGQQGVPASHIWSSTVGLDTGQVLKPAGSVMNGMLFTDELASWGQTSDPSVTSYVNATRGQSDPLAFESMWGWDQIYWFDTVAQHVGFANFNASTLIHFMKTANGVTIPGSRLLVNPGPAAAPAIKQPYSEVLRYNDGKLTVVTQGTHDGWVNGF